VRSGHRAGPLPHVWVWVLLGVLPLAACSTASMQGRVALGEQRWDDAAAHFEAALAREPGAPEALVGLGVARYKQGALRDAEDALRRAAVAEPSCVEARLYLGLVYVRAGKTAAAEDQLVAVRELRVHPRTRALLDQARRVLRHPDLPEAVRGFLAASLESELAWARDVRAAERAPRMPLEPVWLRTWDPRDPFPRSWCP